MRDFVITSESVTAGHPDKLCDRISEAVVDLYLTDDPAAEIVAETAVASGIVFLAVRHRAVRPLDATQVARQTMAEVGYTRAPFNAATCSVLTSLVEDTVVTPGALPSARQHQGTFFGYACRQTTAMMPLPIALAHHMAWRIDTARTGGVIHALHPDCQVQIVARYADRLPVAIEAVTITASTWPDVAVPLEALEEVLQRVVVAPALAELTLGAGPPPVLYVNPLKPQMEGGPTRHAGLTGRKLGIDTYGQFSRQPSAGLSGKDPGRIDRTATYGARWLAKAVVSAEIAPECEVQISYSIGRAAPVSVALDTFGALAAAEETRLAERLAATFDLRPDALVERFDLRALPGRRGGAYFERLACYGHMGRDDLDAPWEDVATTTADLTRAGA